MTILKKICLAIIIILFIASLYNDFKKDSVSIDHRDETMVISDQRVVKVKIERGDTVLSISERLNGKNLSQIAVEQIVADFLRVNKLTDLQSIKVGNYYYFPIYEKTELE